MTDFHLVTPLQRWASVPFESLAEQTAAMRDPRYSDPHDAAYRRAVEQKLSLTTEEGAGVRVRVKTQSHRIKLPAMLPGDEPVPDLESERGLAELRAEAAEQDARRAKGPHVPPTFIPPHTV